MSKSYEQRSGDPGLCGGTKIEINDANQSVIPPRVAPTSIGRAVNVPRHLAFAVGCLRAIHLIDIETLLGGSADDERLIAKALNTYEATVDPKAADTVIVGVSAGCYRHLYEVSILPPGLEERGCNFGFTIVVGHNGQDGPSEALLTAVDLMRRRNSEVLRADYSHATFSTGDGVWSRLAPDLQAEGMRISNPCGEREEWPESTAEVTEPVDGDFAVAPDDCDQAPSARTIHLVDVENLVGGWADDQRLIATALRSYENRIRPDVDDTIIVGIQANFYPQLNGIRVLPAGNDHRGCRFEFTIVVGHNGDDGADEALMTAVSLMRRRRAPLLTEDYPQAAFASGDYKFAALAADMQSEGMSIVQAIGMGRSSGDWTITVEAVQHKIRRPIQKKFDKLYPQGRTSLSDKAVEDSDPEE